MGHQMRQSVWRPGTPEKVKLIKIILQMSGEPRHRANNSTQSSALYQYKSNMQPKAQARIKKYERHVGQLKMSLGT